MRSPVMFASGVALVAVGIIGATVGSVLLATAHGQDCAASSTLCGDDGSAQGLAGIGTMVGGGVSIAVGIPLAFIGGKRQRPDEPGSQLSLVVRGRSVGLIGFF